MTIWWLALILGYLLASLLAFIWLALKVSNGGGGRRHRNASLTEGAAEEVEHIFNDEFREELRNRGRLHFETVIGDNAMFLKQDLDMTVAQLNEYMKKEVMSKLQLSFDAYDKSMKEAEEIAIEAMRKNATAADEQREAMAQKLAADVEQRKTEIIEKFETNMAEVVEHYLLEALGSSMDLKAQLPYILKQLEANREDMSGDMRL